MGGVLRVRRRALTLALPAVLMFLVGAASAAAGGRSGATITGSFGDSCRDFASRSSKDISHVEIHYADGRIVKDETVGSPDYSLDGGAGDETEFAIVKSGTTRETFNCTRPSSPPTAILEVETRGDCFTFGISLYCVPEPPFVVWTRTPEEAIQFPLVDPAHHAPLTFGFRGTSSADPDDDIASWSIDFGDGSSVSGSWSDPPAYVAHTYACFVCGVPTVTLTIVDVAGQADTDTLDLLWIDATPD